MLLLTREPGKGIWIGQMFFKYVKPQKDGCTILVTKPGKKDRLVNLVWYKKFQMHPGVILTAMRHGASQVRFGIKADKSKFSIAREEIREHYNQVRAEMNQAKLKEGQSNVQTVFGQQ